MCMTTNRESVSKVEESSYRVAKTERRNVWLNKLWLFLLLNFRMRFCIFTSFFFFFAGCSISLQLDFDISNSGNSRLCMHSIYQYNLGFPCTRFVSLDISRDRFSYFHSIGRIISIVKTALFMWLRIGFLCVCECDMGLTDLICFCSMPKGADWGNTTVDWFLH